MKIVCGFFCFQLTLKRSNKIMTAKKLQDCMESYMCCKVRCQFHHHFTLTFVVRKCFAQHYWKGKCLRSERWSRERVALIKSLIYVRCNEMHLRCGCQIELNLSADIVNDHSTLNHTEIVNNFVKNHEK